MRVEACAGIWRCAATVPDACLTHVLRAKAAAAHRYSLILGEPSSFCLMTPQRENSCAISSSVTPSGRPDTYTLVLFFSSNHSACPFPPSPLPAAGALLAAASGFADLLEGGAAASSAAMRCTLSRL